MPCCYGAAEGAVANGALCCSMDITFSEVNREKWHFSNNIMYISYIFEIQNMFLRQSVEIPGLLIT